MNRPITLTALAAGTALGALMAAAPAFAQEAPAPQGQTAPVGPPATEAAKDDIVIVGSQIKGSSVTAALPVTVIDSKQIDAIGALSGDDLIRAIPQMGDVTFNPSNNPQTSNAARGDVNSINLRNLGVGNTLVLLNGRRLVSHPVSQAGEGNVPVLGFNSNSLPVANIDRLEVLRDGAAAIYGADAVAGVVNTVTKSDFNGATLDFRIGGPEGTSRREYQLTGTLGRNFAGGRGNVSFYVDLTRRTAQLASDQPYTASTNLLSFFANDPAFASNLNPDGRATQSPWANLAIVGGPGTIRRNPGNVALTNSTGAFHTQSALNPGCVIAINADTCLGTGTRATGTTLRNERFDNAVDTTVTSRIGRISTMLTAKYDLTDSLTAYTELGYYRAVSNAVQPATINLNAIVVPASNYWNPFGPVTFASGQANPNRIPGLTNVPVAGLPVRLTTYRFVDTGPQYVDVTNSQARFLIGLKGKIGSFDFDTGLLYSQAEATDLSDAVNMTKLQASLALSTPDAYNPFNGGCSATPSIGDCNPSSQAAINAIKFKLRRHDKTTLTLGDFKLSNSSLFRLPGGNVGIAVGVEGRRETQRDDRDANLNGSTPFVDAVTGEVSLSNVAAVSPTPSTSGARTVASAFGELAIPLVSPEMRFPLIRRLDIQLAGRYEHYSDFGSVAKPKIAAAWDVFDGLRFRGSYSKGFRAPNLEQTKTVQYSRLSSSALPNFDFYRCEADIRAGRTASINTCTRNISYTILIAGNPDLKPENSTNWTVGVVIEPKFIPKRFGKLTLTADFWSIHQVGIVGQFGAVNTLVLDYLQRVQGSSNPNVIRGPVTATDTADFAGTGLPAAGPILQIKDQFVNLLPQTVQGIDFALLYRVRNTGIGDFSLDLNAARLTKYARENPPLVQSLFDARSAGTINATTPLTDPGDLRGLRQGNNGGKPKWRATASLTWTVGAFQLGGFANYVSSVKDPNFLDTSGNPFIIKGQTTFNLYGQVRIKNVLPGDMRVRIGARNLFDKQPPITSDGYYGSLYNPYGRYLYMTIGTKF